MKVALIALIGVLVVAAPALAQTGNGMPSGQHYNLNLLGKDTCPGDDLKGTNRHTIMVKLNFEDPDANAIVGDNAGADGILGTADDLDLFVNLDKTNKIFLEPGLDFQVLDGNACDGDGAKFQLPVNSSAGADGIWGTADDILYGAVYDVYVRELGKPGGSGDIRTCGTAAGPDGVFGTNDDEVVCSTENVLLLRETGQPKTQKVTKELTTVVISFDGGLTYDRVPIFDNSLGLYFWDYDNNGLRLVQLRFYPVE